MVRRVLGLYVGTFHYTKEYPRMATISEREGLGRAFERLTLDEFAAASPFMKVILHAARSGRLRHADPEVLRESIENNGRSLPVPNVLDLGEIVLPDRSVSLTDRIRAGEYVAHSDEITPDLFSITCDAGSWNFALAHFDVDIFDDTSVHDWSVRNGYLVALHEELLAVGASEKHKHLRRQFPIVQLGTSAIVNGCHLRPFIDGSNGQWALCVGVGNGWRKDCRYLLRQVV